MQFSRRVAWLPASADACGFYRMTLPHLRYPSSGYFPSDPKTPFNLRQLQGYQVAMVQRLMHENNRMAMEQIRGLGLRIVYDLDDNFWSLPKWNPAYRYFQKNGAFQKGLALCAGLAHQITVSTSFLHAVVMRQLQPKIPVTVMENAMDFALFYRATQFRKDQERVTIGWAGTNTHGLDLTEIEFVLARLLRERPQVEIEFMAIELPPELVKANKTYAKDRVRLRPFVSIAEYPAWYSNLRWDIGLAPLALTEFNRCKSNIRMLEAAVLKIPCLASPLNEYEKFCQGNSQLEFLLCHSRDEWFEKLCALVDSSDLRLELGEAMYKRAYEGFNIEAQLPKWNEIFENV